MNKIDYIVMVETPAELGGDPGGQYFVYSSLSNALDSISLKAGTGVLLERYRSSSGYIRIVRVKGESILAATHSVEIEQ